MKFGEREEGREGGKGEEEGERQTKDNEVLRGDT